MLAGMSDRYVMPGWFTRNVFNRAVARLTRLGLSVWGSRVLEVRGRSTGLPRRTPVNMLTLNLAAALAPDAILVNAMHPGWLRTAMGGPDAPVDPSDAAETAYYLATLPDGGTSGLLWQDKRPIDW